MGERIIHISARDGAGYPAKLLELRDDGSTVQIAKGSVDPVAAGLAGAVGMLAGPKPASQLPLAGSKLYEALYQALGEPLQSMLDGAQTTVLMDIEPAELQHIPWEILFWPQPIPGGVTLARVAEGHHLARVYEPDWRLPSTVPKGPLRILIVIGAAEEDADVAAAEELEEIERSIHPVLPTIDFEVVKNHTDLYPMIKHFRPHILHFIGHATANPSRLQFAEKPPQPKWDWDAGTIFAHVGRATLDNWTPNIAFLNACRTGAVEGELGPVAGAFLAAGTRATVAMQGNIKGRAAGCLAGAFYRYLGIGASIDRALTVARSEVGLPFGNKEASYPALTLRCRPTAVLPRFSKPQAYSARERNCPLLAKLKVFVNQTTPRREAHQNLWPQRTGEPRTNFILMRGRSGAGKTVLGTCLLELSANLGHTVRYVRVGRGPVDYVKILDLIWGASDPRLAQISPLLEVLDLQPREQLRNLLDTSKDPTALYALFRQALSGLAKNQPVTIVLDEFNRKMDENSFWTMWEYLVGYLSQPELSNVNLILALSDDDADYYKLDGRLRDHIELTVPKHEVKLTEVDQADFLKLLDRYLSYRSPDFNPSRRKKIRSLMEDEDLSKFRPLSIQKLEEQAFQLASALKIALKEI
jgi:hypothetical protein